MLYRKLSISDIKLVNEVHFSKGFKFYCFSGLILDGKIKDFESAYIIISSPSSSFIRGFAEGFLSEPEFNLHDCRFIINKIEILEEKDIRDGVLFRTLSPIYVKTLRESDGRLIEWDLYPKDGKFYENVHNNLVERYEEYYDKKLGKNYFEIPEILDFKPKRVKIGNSFRRCSLMTFKVHGSEELLKFAHDAGIGEKSAMGFGCLDALG